jgi:hypothetical protein
VSNMNLVPQNDTTAIVTRNGAGEPALIIGNHPMAEEPPFRLGYYLILTPEIIAKLLEMTGKAGMHEFYAALGIYGEEE